MAPQPLYQQFVAALYLLQVAKLSAARVDATGIHAAPIGLDRRGDLIRLGVVVLHGFGALDDGFGALQLGERGGGDGNQYLHEKEKRGRMETFRGGDAPSGLAPDD